MPDIIIFRKYREKNAETKYKGQAFLRAQGVKDIDSLEDEWAKVDDGTSTSPRPRNLVETAKRQVSILLFGSK